MFATHGGQSASPTHICGKCKVRNKVLSGVTNGRLGSDHMVSPARYIARQRERERERGERGRERERACAHAHEQRISNSCLKATSLHGTVLSGRNKGSKVSAVCNGIMKGPFSIKLSLCPLSRALVPLPSLHPPRRARYMARCAGRVPLMVVLRCSPGFDARPPWRIEGEG